MPLLTFPTVWACVAGHTHALPVDADAAVLALKVALAYSFHHLTAFTCRVSRLDLSVYCFIVMESNSEDHQIQTVKEKKVSRKHKLSADYRPESRS